MSPQRFLAEHSAHDIAMWQAFHKLEAMDQKQAEAKAKNESDVANSRRRRR